MIKWYRYWVIATKRMVFEDYFFFPSTTFTTKDIKCDCEEWAERLTDMQYEHYSYDFEEVKAPPRKWLENCIEGNKLRIVLLNKKSEIYEKMIDDHYRLNDKIEKLKNNINDEMD